MSQDVQQMTLPDARVKKALLWFAALLAVLAAGASLFVIEMGFKRHYVAIMMWTPAVSALLACRFTGIDKAVFGWSWGAVRWQWLAFATPILYGLVAYGIIWGAGLGGVPDPKFLQEAGYHLGLVGWSAGATIAMGVVIFGAVGMIWHMATALGEEIGWRGFLTPMLLRLTSFPLASLITGLVWLAWHVPLIYFTKYNAGPVDLHIQVFNFGLMAVGLSFIMTYFRLRSGSLWTATVIHAAHNAYILSILQPMTIQYESTWRYANEFGIVLPVVVALFGLYFWYRAHREGLTGKGAETTGAE
jgi:membrane protease YdiL (CAAX protease family)